MAESLSFLDMFKKAKGRSLSISIILCIVLFCLISIYCNRRLFQIAGHSSRDDNLKVITGTPKTISDTAALTVTPDDKKPPNQYEDQLKYILKLEQETIRLKEKVKVLELEKSVTAADEILKYQKEDGSSSTDENGDTKSTIPPLEQSKESSFKLIHISLKNRNDPTTAQREVIQRWRDLNPVRTCVREIYRGFINPITFF